MAELLSSNCKRVCLQAHTRLVTWVVNNNQRKVLGHLFALLKHYMMLSLDIIMINYYVTYQQEATQYNIP